MSFSGKVKEELARQYSKSRHCQIAELAAIFLMDGRINQNPLSLEFCTENPLLFEKISILMQRAFSIDVWEPVSPGDALRVLGAFRLLKGDSMESVKAHMETCCCDGLLLQKTCCRRAFIRGAFMASGSISDPRKSYHFEIVCKTMDQAEQLRRLVNGFEADAKIVERKGRFVVYLKESSQIVDMLNVMEAYVSLMNLENMRILKEMRNHVNRKVNCETANIGKTVNAAVRQIADITFIRDSIGLDELPQSLREIALVRLEYPEASLKELGEYLDPPVGKSGVNHRLRKLSQMADNMRDRP